LNRSTKVDIETKVEDCNFYHQAAIFFHGVEIHSDCDELGVSLENTKVQRSLYKIQPHEKQWQWYRPLVFPFALATTAERQLVGHGCV
jgi:hypothetical protein